MYLHDVESCTFKDSQCFEGISTKNSVSLFACREPISHSRAGIKMICAWLFQLYIMDKFIFLEATIV